MPKGVYPRPSVEERFWRMTEKKGKNKCWLWKGKLDDDGYGGIRVENKSIGSHRASYLLHKGEIPKGMCVCHECDTPACVNPYHLFLGTSQENTRDSTLKGRRAKGERHAKAKLTVAKVLKIRSLHATKKYTYVKLGRMFGVEETTIARVVSRFRWKHV